MVFYLLFRIDACFRPKLDCSKTPVASYTNPFDTPSSPNLMVTDVFADLMFYFPGERRNNSH